MGDSPVAENPYPSKEGRDAFRSEFPKDSPVVPIDILARSHQMLSATEDKVVLITGIDRDIVGFLKQVRERPSLYADSLDGLETLFYTSLTIRGMIHGDSDLWRATVRRFGDRAGPLHSRHAGSSMEDFARTLWSWVTMFDVVVKERAESGGSDPIKG